LCQASIPVFCQPPMAELDGTGTSAKGHCEAHRDGRILFEEQQWGDSSSWGCMATTRLPEQARGGKLGSKGTAAIHRGVDDEAQAWRVMGPAAGRLSVTRSPVSRGAAVERVERQERPPGHRGRTMEGSAELVMYSR